MRFQPTASLAALASRRLKPTGGRHSPITFAAVWRLFMPQAIANPEDLRRFSAELKQFNNQLRESTSRLQAQFVRLGDTWRDQEHQKFAQEFEQTMRVLAHFMRTADEHIPFLLRKAQRIEEYLQQR
jgi:uncharacterized protein YukE